MGIIKTTCLAPEKVDTSKLTDRNISYGFLLHLPFRVRVGDSYHTLVKVENTEFDIWFKNQISVPHGEPLAETLQKNRDSSKLSTDVLLLVKHPKVSSEDIEILRMCNPKEDLKYPRGSNYTFDAMKALNHFLVAYATGGDVIFGGRPLHLFKTNDFIELLDWELTLILEEDKEINTEALDYIFNLQKDKNVSSVPQFTGEMTDFDSKTLSKISEMTAIHGDFLFYEHAFEAKTKMVAGDYTGALLMAVAAFEGAHAVYVSDILADLLPETGDKREIIDGYTRELGMSLCNKLSPYLFFNEIEKPDQDAIENAGKGLKYRNEIMHALRNRSGQYRHRLRTNKEISDAYVAVLKVYESYRRGVEKHTRIKNESNNT